MRISAIGSMVVFATGCGTALGYIPTHPAPRRVYVHGPEQVELFMAARPTRPYVEVGMIESQQEQYSQDTSGEVLEKMREFAGQKGCDGLVIFTGNDAEIGPQQVGGASRQLVGYRGSCIVYVDPNMPPPPPPPPPPTAPPQNCMPNATQLCYGAGGCKGGQSCTADGRGFTPCDCGPNTPVAAPSPSPTP
jgi:hypothetical protein